jgi:large subunit ribosomal protein L3
MEKDGYKAVQVAFEEKRENLVSKPEKGKFKKAEITPKRYVKELALENAESYQLGAKIDCSIFSEGDLVDVVGTSKGHGWSGLIKKWNFSRMNMSHGNGPVHRHAGGTGANTYPGKVFKGHKMSGRWGNERVTIQNLKIVKVDAEHNIILIKGAVPGVKGSLLTIKEAVKAN